ncbi:ABC transporter ATP-binding protein [Amphibacillus sediminis]|uniref:ABC transporter ATP-binding protein n=1 Tax=Amphibacillus sediminis TaxID=360185 RepID=UPI0008329148|nr:ABC transporter ATP-binding protein [Amphibacillus sediminis]
MNGFNYHDVTVAIQQKKILDQVNFTLKPNSITALIGHNGAGKSTIMKSILGLVDIKEGAVTLNDVQQLDDFITFKSKLAYIPEEPLLLSELTVQQHFQLYMNSYNLNEAETEDKVHNYIDSLEIKDKLNEYPESLSKGMRQKVQAICALLPDVDLLLIDEPFMGLDVHAADFLANELRMKAQQGTMVLLTTHQLDRLTELADDYIMLQQGRIIDQGEMASFSELKRRFEDS